MKKRTVPKGTGCIRTGCTVHFGNYNIVVSADVFRVGKTLIIRTHPDQVKAGGDPAAANHTPELWELEVWSTQTGEEFWRPDIGVFVVEEDVYGIWLIPRE
jgi:hypothetical protein